MANSDLTLALKIKALVEGVDQIKGLADDINKLEGSSNTPMGDPTGPLREGISLTTSLVKEAEMALLGFFAFEKIKDFVKEAITNFNEAERGFRGLEAVANASGVKIGAAMQEAARLASDGLITLQQAQRALQNLLARGYDLSQASQALEAIKNVASVARAQGLSIGEALLLASEGIKKSRSLELEESGVIVKLGDAWKGYGGEIGLATSNMSDAQKIQAEFNSIMQYSASYMGNAEEASKSLEGKMAKLANQNQETSAQLGNALAPALLALMKAGIFATENWVKPAILWVQRLIIAYGALNEALGAVLEGRFDKVKTIGDLAKQASIDAEKALQGDVKFAPRPTGSLPKPASNPASDPYEDLIKNNTEAFKQGVDEQIKDAQRLSAELIKAFDNSIHAQKAFGAQAKKLRDEANAGAKDSSVEGQAKATLDLVAAQLKLLSIKGSAPLEDVQAQSKHVQELAKGLDDQATAQEAINRAKLAEADALDKAAAAEKTQQAGIAKQQQENDARIAALQAMLKDLTAGKVVQIDADTSRSTPLLLQLKSIWDSIQDKVVKLTVDQVGVATPIATIPGHAAGAVLDGYGGGDRRLILVEDGEAIVRKEAVRMMGRGFFDTLNAMRVPRYAIGGIIGNTLSEMSPGANGLHPVTLNFPGVGSWDMSARPDIVAGLKNALAIEALKHGRRG